MRGCPCRASLADGDDDVALALAVGAAGRGIEFAVENGVDLGLGCVSMSGFGVVIWGEVLTSGHGPLGPMGVARMGEAMMAATMMVNDFMLCDMLGWFVDVVGIVVLLPVRC